MSLILPQRGRLHSDCGGLPSTLKAADKYLPSLLIKTTGTTATAVTRLLAFLLPDWRWPPRGWAVQIGTGPPTRR